MLQGLRAPRAAILTRLAVIALLPVASCSLSASGSGWEHGGGSATYVEATSLFLDDGSGRVTFSTNEAAYQSPRGYTVWTEVAGMGGVPDVSFREVSCAASKETGDAAAGFGLVFCRGQNGSGDESMYVLMTNVRGQFAVGKAVRAAYVPIRPWTASSALMPGWGAENRLRVTRDGQGGRFTAWCNGTAVCEFEGDAEVGAFGGAGYVVVISPYDDFPESTVKVVFSR